MQNSACFSLKLDVLLDIVAPIHEVYDVNDGPTDRDLEDAMLSIINIQFVYDLNVEDVSSVTWGDNVANFQVLDSFFLADCTRETESSK